MVPLREGEYSGKEQQGIYSLIYASESLLHSQRGLKMALSLFTRTSAPKHGEATDSQGGDVLTQKDDGTLFSPCLEFHCHTKGEIEAVYKN